MSQTFQVGYFRESIKFVKSIKIYEIMNGMYSSLVTVNLMQYFFLLPTPFPSAKIKQYCKKHVNYEGSRSYCSIGLKSLLQVMSSRCHSPRRPTATPSPFPNRNIF